MGNHHNCVKTGFHCNNQNHNSINKDCPEYISQRKIKDILSFENKSYFAVSEVVQQLPHKPNNQFIPVNVSSKELKTLSDESNITIAERYEIYKNSFIASQFPIMRSSNSTSIHQSPKKRKSNSTCNNKP